MSIIGIALILLVGAFIHGSWETRPTEEQHGKARIFWFLCALPLIATELALWALLRYVRRKTPTGFRTLRQKKVSIRGEPPLPDTEAAFSSANEREIERLHSTNQLYRAVITRDAADHYRV